jgi:hypothetical protein
MDRMGFPCNSRRRFLLSLPVAVLAVAVVDAVWIEPRWLKVRRLRLSPGPGFGHFLRTPAAFHLFHPTPVFVRPRLAECRVEMLTTMSCHAESRRLRTAAEQRAASEDAMPFYFAHTVTGPDGRPDPDRTSLVHWMGEGVRGTAEGGGLGWEEFVPDYVGPFHDGSAPCATENHVNPACLKRVLHQAQNGERMR